MGDCETIIGMVFVGLGIGGLFIVLRESLGIPV